MAFTGKIGYLEIESPFGNAGGVVKTPKDVERMAMTGVGWIEGGSYTFEGRLGNAFNPETGQFDKRVYHHDPITGVTTNSLGMPNIGFFGEESQETVLDQMPHMVQVAHNQRKPFVANVAPVSSSPLEESQELVAAAFSAGADAVLLNGGCPNVVEEDGGRHQLLSRDPDALYEVLNGLRGVVGRHREIFLRVSPLREDIGVPLVAKAVKCSAVVSAVFTPDTWPGHQPVDAEGEYLLDVPSGIGGASGSAYADKSLVETSMWVEQLQGSGIDVVRSSGVTSAREVKRSLDVGAVAAAGTTFFYESPLGWRQHVDGLLTELAQL